LRSARRCDVARRRNCYDTLGDKLGRESRQGLIIPIRPAFFDTDVAALDEACLRQPFPEGVGIKAIRIGGGGVQKADEGQVRGLGPCQDRASHRRPTKK
jgi:hypothetical protein